MHHIVIQYATPEKIPGATLLKRWAHAALRKKKRAGELTIRLVGIKEMTQLNTRYKNKKSPTNVLAFPFDMSELPGNEDILGDIVICSDVVNRQAKEQGKPIRAHWAHMVVHGTLHLLGFDHMKPVDAKKMEALEIKILKSLGFSNPYIL